MAVLLGSQGRREYMNSHPCVLTLAGKPGGNSTLKRNLAFLGNSAQAPACIAGYHACHTGFGISFWTAVYIEGWKIGFSRFEDWRYRVELKYYINSSWKDWMLLGHLLDRFIYQKPEARPWQLSGAKVFGDHYTQRPGERFFYWKQTLICSSLSMLQKLVCVASFGSRSWLEFRIKGSSLNVMIYRKGATRK